MTRSRNILFRLQIITLIGAVVYLASVFLKSLSMEDVSQVSRIQLDEEANARRQKNIEKFCKAKRSSRLDKTVARWSEKGIHSRPRLYYSESMKFIFCETPKCGTTQWRNLMLIIDGHLEGYEAGPENNFESSMKHNFMWTKFNLMDRVHVSNVIERLRKYYKIMTTREPLERLVSAYRDKLERYSEPFYFALSKKIHKDANLGSPPGLASFEEFIDFILSTENRMELDPHWKPYSELCDPCNIKYDYVATMETVYDDAAFITRDIGVAKDRIYNATGRKGQQEKRRRHFYKYFLTLPVAKRDAIFKYYKDQYDMFAYEYPSFISDSEFTQQ